jgi:malate dehydrogenase (oxaloacetate-decarboxylating)
VYKNYQIVRTLRFKNVNIPGILGKLTTAIGSTGTSIGTITTIHFGNKYVIRDVDVFVDGKEHLSRVLKEVSKIKEVKILEIRDAVLEMHKDGLIDMVNTHPINSIEDVRKIYSPGVAEVCKLISDNNSWKDTYTSIPYSVAIITDGTNVLEFGNIGPWASMPVIEAKAALFQRLVGVSGIPILLNTTNEADIVKTIKHIAMTFGGIQLTGISSPRCFSILDLLNQKLNIPIIHDDQQGNAVVTLAALINACKYTNVELDNSKIGIIGLGTVGISIAKLIMKPTGNPVLGTTKSNTSAQMFVDLGGMLSSLEKIMNTCEIIIAATAQGDIIKPDMIKKGQIIFALSQPHPEITPELALQAGAALAINSRALNNLLSCPGIWRGTFDAAATSINYEMYKAATIAIANAATEDEILPTTLNPELHLAVTHAVAHAALETGIANRKLDDDYFDNKDIKLPPWHK